MDRYLANLLPRLRRYSKDLNKVEVFVDKSWKIVDNDGNSLDYLFMRDKRLLISFNGNTTTGSWELLPTGNILVNRFGNPETLENAFIDDDVMILQKCGPSEGPLVFFNADKIINGGILRYLEEKEYTLRQSDPAEEKVPLLNSSGIVMGYPYLVVGKRIKTYNEDVVTGTYKTSNKANEQYVIVTNNLVTEHYYISTCQLKDGKSIFVRTVGPAVINKGDYVENHEELKLRTDQKIRIRLPTSRNYIVKVDAEGKITHTHDADIWLALLFWLILLGVILLVNIL
jgi:hypothetical protein